MSPIHLSSVVLAVSAVASMVGAAPALAQLLPLHQSTYLDDTFYLPPSPLLQAAAGTVIRSRTLTNSAALPSAAKNLLVLYHSRSLDGRDIAVSGTVAIPAGQPPAGGWPVTTWAHGTTGIGPTCAPSRDTPDGPEHAFLGLKQVLMDSYVRRGYVVLATDYEGLGGPGIHPFLQGESEGRGALDIVRAARSLDSGIGKQYVAIGHSQGGHADLFTAAIGPAYAPELELLGNVAMAPASHIGMTVQGLAASSQPSYALAYVMYVLQSFASNHPSIDLKKVLTPHALAQLPETRQTCITASSSAGYWASAIPKDQFLADADLSEVLKVADVNEPSGLRISVPTLIVQGTADDTVLPSWTDSLVRSLCKNGNNVSYTAYADATHETIPKRSAAQVHSWIDARFAGSSATTGCGNLPWAGKPRS